MKMRATKIVATVGPASRDPRVVRRLVQQVDVFRINFSHGDRDSHLEEIRTIRSEARRARKTVAILQDLPGPKIRVGKIAKGAVSLERGMKLELVPGPVEGDATTVPVNYPVLLRAVKKGDTLHLADGVIRLRVDGPGSTGVLCTVLAGGVLSSGKGINAPGVRMGIDYPTRSDQSHLKFGLRHGVDFVAISFVRTPDDVRSVRKLIPSGGPLLITKIEKGEAVANFDRILEEADGVMVARGDLGIEVPMETVPSIQRSIVGKCSSAGKPVIVATQMLVSMVNFPVPSRAEVTDVSTAVLQGTDAVMLSDETTVGRYPVDSVLMLDKIARSTEKSVEPPDRAPSGDESRETGSAIARAACRLADYVGAKAIVAPTQTGSTARRVSMFRPRQPIIALCDDARVARRLALYRGVHPLVSRTLKSIDAIFERADDAAVEMGAAKKGERVVVTCGTPGIQGSTNLVKVSVVGSRA